MMFLVTLSISSMTSMTWHCIDFMSLTNLLATLKLVGDGPTNQPTDRPTDIVTYRAAIAAKNWFRPIFSPLQATLRNFDVFSWQFFFRYPIFFWWGGAKTSKNVFDQFSCHFRQFWTTLIFVHCWQTKHLKKIKKMGGGGLPQIYFYHFSSS